MPYHQHALPVTATSLSIRHRGETYPLLLDTDTFTRTGEDDIPIVPLCGGDEFVGESLEGQWHKGWDNKIDTFTATIDGSVLGVLRLTGVAVNPGIAGWGGINSHHPLPMLDDLEVTVSMEVPVDDSGVTDVRDIFYEFYIKQDKDEIDPFGDNNYLVVYYDVDEEGLKLYIKKRVNGAAVETLASGKDYNMAGDRGVGDLEATIWRFVFNGKPGTAGATLSVHLKQSDTLANVETATEHEVTGSPFDISDLAFNVGYPCYAIYTENATYFGTAYDSANRAASGYLRVSYPSQFNVNYNFTEADYGKGEVALYDGDPDSGGVRVYDEDHAFINKPYIQNGLIRLHVDEGAARGPKILYYNGATWVQPVNQVEWYEVTNMKTLQYSYLLSIMYVSPEKVILRVRLCDSAVNNEDYYVDLDITLVRGSYSVLFEPIIIFPSQAVISRFTNSTRFRFGYTGDNKIGDDDLGLNGTNITLTDNFEIGFDDTKTAILYGMYSNLKPDLGSQRFQAFDGGYLSIENYSPGIYRTLQVYYYIVPFSLVANLFEEAEDATLGALTARLFTDPTGASTFVRAQSAAPADVGQILTIYGDTAAGRATDTITLNGNNWVNGSVDFTRVYILHLSAVTAGNITVQGSDAGAVHIIPAGTTHVDNCVILDAPTEYVRHDFTAGTDLPAGRYLAALRISDLNQVADDVEIKITNFTDNEQRGEQGKPFTVTAAAAYGYFCEFFDITDTDVSTLDSMRITVTKDLIAGNEIYVDYFLIVPIGNGMNWSQDLSHSALRGITQHPRLSER